jgi:hypothetical protein
MANKKKAIIISASVVLLGIGGYFLYDYLKNRDKKDDEEEEEEYTPPSTPSGGGSGSGYTPTYGKPADVDTTAFQKYVINVKKDGAILAPYGADGDWGGKTKSAWEKYGDMYRAYKKAQQLSSQGTTPQVVTFNKLLNGALKNVNRPENIKQGESSSSGIKYFSIPYTTSGITVRMIFRSNGTFEVKENTSNRLMHNGTYNVKDKWGGYEAFFRNGDFVRTNKASDDERDFIVDLAEKSVESY